MLILNIPFCKEIIRIECENRKAEERLALHYWPFISYSECENYNQKNLVFFRQVKDKLFFSYKEVNQCIPITDEINLPWLIKRIIHGTIQEEEDYVFLHGACLGKNGKAFILMGPTKTGKSTLSAYLIAKGYEYYTDDCVILNCKNKEIEPYRKLIEMRERTEKVLDIYGIELSSFSLKDDVLMQNYLYLLPSNLSTEVNHLAAMFFLSRDEKQEEINILSSYEAIKQCTYNLYCTSRIKDKLGKIMDIAGNIPAYVLNNNRLDRAHAMIELIAGEKKYEEIAL